MKKYFLLITLFKMLTLPSVYAQNYRYVSMPDSGSVWSEEWWDMYTSIYERFTVFGEDTVIDGITYNKLYLFYDSVFNKNTAIAIGGIREDSLKRVYYRGERLHTEKPPGSSWNYLTKEFLLYNFSLQIGDSIGSGRSSVLIISYIDTVLINGTYRRRLSISPIKDDKWNDYWIEGIGSSRGLLCPHFIHSVGENNRLICFIQDNKTLYHNSDYNSCFPSNLEIGKKEITLPSVTIFPNPVKKAFFTIVLNGGNFEITKIFNAHGTLMDSFYPKGESQLKVNGNKYPAGIYFYVATTKNGIQYTGKFVVL